MAEALLRHHLEARGVDAHVSSTGLTFEGRPATAEAADVLAGQGLDLSRHASRTLAAEQVEAADLVLGMERQHVREAYLLVPDALPRSFTLPEFVRRATGVGPRRGDLASWLAEVSAGRRPADLVGESTLDEVADPYGSPLAVYERTAAQLDELCAAAADLLAGHPPVPSSTPDRVGVGAEAAAAANGCGAGGSASAARGLARLWRR